MFPEFVHPALPDSDTGVLVVPAALALVSAIAACTARARLRTRVHEVLRAE